MPLWGSAQACLKWTPSSASMARSASWAAARSSLLIPFIPVWTSMNSGTMLTSSAETNRTPKAKPRPPGRGYLPNGVPRAPKRPCRRPRRVGGTAYGRGSDPAQDRGDLAEDGRLVAVDRVVGLVVRHQPDVAVLALERLDGGLVVEHGRDDVAVVGGRLLAHDDPVAVADRGVDHRVADDLEQEQLALADDLLGQREDVLDDLLGQDRSAGRDTAHHGHV